MTYRDEQDRNHLRRSLANLHLAGVAVDWSRVVPPDWNFVELPRQRLQRAVFWQESEESRVTRLSAPAHPLLGYRLGTSFPCWQSHVSANEPPYLADHVVNGSVEAEETPWHDQPYSAAVTLPPLGVVWLVPES